MKNSKSSKRVKLVPKGKIVLVLAMTVKTGKVPGKLPSQLVTVNEGARSRIFTKSTTKGTKGIM
jgi:hypothetical protein